MHNPCIRRKTDVQYYDTVHDDFSITVARQEVSAGFCARRRGLEQPGSRQRSQIKRPQLAMNQTSLCLAHSFIGES